ncbi:DUF4352 domain-containing protein [Candidatus Saganbacteria bacterium]|nr:DUF4352 domain-containing protein [Candidatus Saganbacteria bacterium]
MSTRQKILGLFLFLVFVYGISDAAVIINGKPTSLDIYDNNGEPYVSVKALAKALGAGIATDDQGNIKISTSSADGANQITGVAGSIGQTLFNGITRFTVNGVETADTDPFNYKLSEGRKFVLISVEIKNGSKKARQYGYTAHKITLVDDKGQLYTNDAMKQDVNWGYMVGITDLVPGGFIKGKFVFELPTESTPERIVFEPNPLMKEKAFRVNLREHD